MVAVLKESLRNVVDVAIVESMWEWKGKKMKI